MDSHGTNAYINQKRTLNCGRKAGYVERAGSAAGGWVGHANVRVRNFPFLDKVSARNLGQMGKGDAQFVGATLGQGKCQYCLLHFCFFPLSRFPSDSPRVGSADGGIGRKPLASVMFPCAAASASATTTAVSSQPHIRT